MDSVSTDAPSVEDIHGDVNVRSSSLPASEIDAAFGYGSDPDRLTEVEVDILWTAEMERRDAAANKPAPRFRCWAYRNCAYVILPSVGKIEITDLASALWPDIGDIFGRIVEAHMATKPGDKAYVELTAADTIALKNYDARKFRPPPPRQAVR